MTLREIEKHIFGPETRTNEYGVAWEAKRRAEESGNLDITRMFKKTRLEYLNKKEQRKVARIIQEHIVNDPA